MSRRDNCNSKCISTYGQGKRFQDDAQEPHEPSSQGKSSKQSGDLKTCEYRFVQGAQQVSFVWHGVSLEFVHFGMCFLII